MARRRGSCIYYLLSNRLIICYLLSNSLIILGMTALNYNLAEYDARMKTLPELVNFYNSEQGQKRMGINAPIAAFNSIDDYVFAKV